MSLTAPAWCDACGCTCSLRDDITPFSIGRWWLFACWYLVIPLRILKLPWTGTELPGVCELLVAAISFLLSLRRPLSLLECCMGPEPSRLACPVVLAEVPMFNICWREAHEVELWLPPVLPVVTTAPAVLRLPFVPLP